MIPKSGLPVSKGDRLCCDRTSRAASTFLPTITKSSLAAVTVLALYPAKIYTSA